MKMFHYIENFLTGFYSRQGSSVFQSEEYHALGDKVEKSLLFTRSCFLRVH